MTTITAFQSITLDGVMQGPARPDEDTRGEFHRGGWAAGYQDEVSMAYAAEGMRTPGALLFGHRTYRDVLDHWTSRPEPNPFAQVLVSTPKYVVSRDPSTVLGYPSSTLLAGDGVERVRELKAAGGADLLVMGSGELVRALHAAHLVDRFTLQVHPIVLGTGTRLFDGGERAELTLRRTIPTTTGVVIAEYAVR